VAGFLAGGWGGLGVFGGVGGVGCLGGLSVGVFFFFVLMGYYCFFYFFCFFWGARASFWGAAIWVYGMVVVKVGLCAGIYVVWGRRGGRVGGGWGGLFVLRVFFFFSGGF